MDERSTRQPDEWLLMHVIRRTWWHIDEGWDAVAPRHRRRWLITMAAGLVALLLLTAGLVFIARALEGAGALQWEAGFVKAFERHAPFSFGWAIWIESPGNGVVLWPLVLVAAAIAAWRRRTLLALTIACGFIAALITTAVAAGRLRLGAHWPTDIIAGAIIGAFWMAVLLRAVREEARGRTTLPPRRSRDRTT